MPGISNDFEEKYSDILRRIEEKMPGAELISAKTANYPVYRQKVRFTVTSLRKAGMLEEFIMKAASLGLSGGTDIALLSRMLGMDEVFLISSIDYLADKNVIQKEALPMLKLTENGEKHLNSGTVPADEEVEEIEYYIDKKSGIFYTGLVKDDSLEFWEHYNLIEQHIENVKKYISRKFICDVGKASSREIEPANGARRISSMISAKITGEAHTAITEFWLKTAGSDAEVCLIWDHSQECFRDDLASVVQKYADSAE